jgi:hypothetical protein
MGKTKSKKASEKVRKRIEKYLSEGDYDSMEDLLSELNTIRDSKAAIESVRDFGLKNYGEFVDNLLKNSPNATRNPMVWIHVLNEMLMRSLTTDFGRYIRLLREFPLRHYYSSIKETFEGVEGQTLSFKNDDIRPVKEAFTTFYENYKKLCVHFSHLAEIADSKLEDETKHWKPLFPNQESRYYCLSVSKADTFIRNAISHKTFRRLPSGKYELTDRNGKNRMEYTVSFLDKRLQSLWARIHFSNIAMSISGVFSNHMILVAIDLSRSRKRQK